MKNILVLFAIYFLMLVSIVNSQKQLDTNNIFSHYDEIKLPNNIIIGSIASLDVYNEKLYLITDAISKKVFLFDTIKQKIVELNAEKCTPGFNLLSVYATFNKEGRIYVINERSTGYTFNRDGACEGKLENYYRIPHICFLTSGRIIAYSNIGDGNYLKLSNSRGKELDRFGYFPDKYKSAIERIMGGGLVTDNQDYVYQVNVISPTIFVYKNRKLFQEIRDYNHTFNMINHDINDPHNPMSLLTYFKKLSQEYSIVDNLFMANSNTLLVQFVNNRKNNKEYFVQLVSTDGKQYLKNPIVSKKRFIFAKNGFAYKIIQPKPINDVLPNPKIVVYKINSIYK